MNSPCVALSQNLFPAPRDARLQQTGTGKWLLLWQQHWGLWGASSTSQTWLLQHRAAEGPRAFVTIISKGLLRDILKPAFPAECSVMETEGGTKLHQTVITEALWPQVGIFLHHSISIPLNNQRVGGFLPVCLLLRSTIIGKTSTFLMGYFSSVFFLQYFVKHSPKTVTSQFMKVLLLMYKYHSLLSTSSEISSKNLDLVATTVVNIRN